MPDNPDHAPQVLRVALVTPLVYGAAVSMGIPLPFISAMLFATLALKMPAPPPLVGFTWVKPNRVSAGYFMGTGYYTRANPEQCLLATRGKPTVLARDVRQLVHSPRREHSRKPDEVRQGIERLFAGPYIELFARETTPGWDSWGNEVGLFDDGPVETRRQPSALATRVARGA